MDGGFVTGGELAGAGSHSAVFPLQTPVFPLQEVVFPLQEVVFPLQEVVFPLQESVSLVQDTGSSRSGAGGRVLATCLATLPG
ncbi:hypothetical protein Atai01_65410 [Amycolatopsis taiwanensis]|uniref:Uncharacterized protein n=1 Tax=Amycolatopsis taiwanensis TaxID=342230 RepID=A0A9W6VJY6_9PSEU|nr:hypothetical protein Atai01_65410 [Amycolatopsis taiwanensis]